MATKKNKIYKNILYNKTFKKKLARAVNKNSNSKSNSIVCKKYFNNYNTFEDKVESVFKKNKIDILSTTFNLEKDILRTLNQAVSTSKIKPQNDFYSYINERWLKAYDAEISHQYFAQHDNFRLVQDKVFKELLFIIENYVRDHKNSKKPFDISFIKFYKSGVVANTNKKHFFIQHANNIIMDIDNILKENNLWKLLAYINDNEIVNWGSPLSWTLNPDDREPSIFRSYITGPNLSLVDLSVYFNDGTNVQYKANYKKKYLKNLRDIFAFFFGEHNEYNVHDVLDVETEIANAFACNDIKKKNNELETNYYKLTPKEALDKYDFDWDEYAKQLGFNTTPDFFITPDLNYLSCICKLLLKEWNTSKWRTYWIYIYIRMIIRYNRNVGKLYFDFHGNFQRGIEKPSDYKLQRVFLFGYAFNTFLTNEYIKYYKNDANVNYVKAMADDLKTVFIRIIKRNTWLQPKTKEKALEKLQNLKLQVGSPNKLTPDPILDYSDNDLWENLVMTSKWRHKKAISLEGKHVIDFPIIDWSHVPIKFASTQAYVVNASYTPSKNSIYIPLGYIQKPFVDLDERGIEYNLAHIGFTLAHEMSHALDDLGSQYNENGKLENWWTNEDRRKFRKIQEDVVKQYETFAAYDGIIFDAWPTIGEDLADISGITICREYLRDFQLKNKDILPIVDLSFRVFFVYFAFQQRQKINKRAIKAQLLLNPHPLDKYRCNVPLSRLEIFRTIFDVKKGDKMWWHSTNRIWES